MIIQDLKSNTDEWLRHRRLHKNASEAPMMMSASKNVTRNELLHMKATGLDREFSDWFQKNILDNGHTVEAAARPIAEKIVGEDLFPVSATDDEGWLAASFDGQTMLETINWECKQWNKEKAADVEAGKVPECDYWQLVHQQAVNPGSETLYMVTDGTEENCVHLWFTAPEADIKRLKAGWQQFEKDLAEYVPAEPEQPKVTGTSPDQLPALNIQATGMVTASNLDEFKAHAKAVLSEINTELVTDEHFATAEKTVKWCKETEKRLATAKESLLSQTSSIYDALNTIDSVNGEVREMRLKLDKAVKSQKESRKAEILANAKQAFSEFLRGLHVANYMPSINPDFAGAIKGLKTMSSVQSACDDELARAKIEANEIAEVIATNQAYLDKQAGSHRFLFNDFGQICQKPAEDFAAIVKSRIADHREAEEKRLEAEREKIRQEEEAKAKREAEQKAQQEAAAKAKPEPEADPAPAVTGQGRENQEGAEVPRNMQELAQTRTPTTNEIIAVLCRHYGADRQTVIQWLQQIEVQEAA